MTKVLHAFGLVFFMGVGEWVLCLNEFFLRESRQHISNEAIETIKNEPFGTPLVRLK